MDLITFDVTGVPLAAPGGSRSS
ncbi:MAG: hypothetical protein U1E33_08955 [Rhodospirillales bacterium]